MMSERCCDDWNEPGHVDHHELPYKPVEGVTWSPADLLARIEALEALSADKHNALRDRVTHLELIVSSTNGLRARAAALEAQVRELRAERDAFAPWLVPPVPAERIMQARAWLEENCAFPVDTGDNAPPLKQATKADFANPEARAALASAAGAQGIQAQAILDELDNDDNAPKVPCDYPHCETPCERPCDESHLVEDKVAPPPSEGEWAHATTEPIGDALLDSYLERHPDNAKCACGMSASGQHDEVCPSHD